MNKILLILIVFTSALSAQPPGYSLSNGFGSVGYDISHAIALDTQGNFFITGSFEGTVDVDPSASVFNLVSSGGSDIFVAKYDIAGDLVFAFSIGSLSNGESGNSITTDSNGEIIVTGNFKGTVDFDPSASAFTLTSSGNSDVFVAKYSSTGNFIWAFKIGSVFDDVGKKVLADNSGNVFVTGFFEASVDFDPSLSTYTISSLSPSADCFIAKYNSSGNFLWAKAVGGGGHDEGTGLSLNPAGDVFLSGNFNVYALVNSVLPSHTLTATGSNDGFIAKCNGTTGSFIWANAIGGPFDDTGNDICSDALGNVYACGTFSGSGYFDPGNNTVFLNAGSAKDIFIAKYNTSGAYQWAKNIGNNVNDCHAYSIGSDQNNNIVITGELAGITDFDPSPNTFTLGASNGYEVFTAKYNSAGGFLWAFNTEGTGNSAGYGIAVNAADQVLITGAMQDTVDFDFTAGTYTLNFSVGTKDVFFARYNQMPCSPPPTPTNVTAQQNKTVCANSSITLSVNGAGTISWFNSSAGGSAFAYGDTVIFSPSTSGTFTVYAEANNCAVSALREVVTFTVYAQPTINIASSGTICAGESATLTASGANSYSWNVSLAGNQIVVSPSLTTSYSVTGTNTVGCSQTAAYTLSVQNCAGLPELIFIEGIKVYPNPSEGTINVVCDHQLVLMEIFDAFGRLLRSEHLSKQTLSFEKLEKGIYFLKFSTDSGSLNKKIIIE